MGWADLLAAFTDIPQLLTSRNDDDMFDRMNHRWTAGTLVLCAILVSTTQYVGDPIHCWAPKHFSDAWEDYSNSYCWVRNTYYIPFDEDIPRDPELREKNPVIYYQWVPLILLVQAMLFYLPIAFWRTLNCRTGVDVNDIVEASEKLHGADMATREKLLKIISKQLHRYIRRSKKPPITGTLCVEGCRLNIKCVFSYICCCFIGKRFGNFMVVVYLMTKLIFIGNVLGQLFLLDKFLGQDFHKYGINVISEVSDGKDWTDTPRFPTVTLCDLEIRRLGNVQKYTLQCVLTINLFNEKIYLYLWFWFILIGFISIAGLTVWLLRIFVPGERQRYIRQFIRRGRNYDPTKQQDQKALSTFVHDYLRQDGVLVLRLVDLNTNKHTVQDLTNALWDIFLGLGPKPKSVDSDHNDVINV